jgi:glycerophosphoryl diester phosphodiesterase
MKLDKISDIQGLVEPLIIGHRGYKARYPENTLLAFEKAVDAGCPAIELDVTLSIDRSIVVIHDETLNRTTNGKGDVSEFTISQLKDLDAGSWFEPSFRGVKIPELSDVFSSIGSKALINVEIKKECYEKSFPNNSIERKVLELIHSRKLENRVIISSFNSDILKRVKTIDSGVATAYIFDRIPDDLDEIVETGIFSVHIGHGIADQSFVKEMHEKGVKVLVWTVNNKKLFDQLIKDGVDGVFTDDPGLFIR